MFKTYMASAGAGKTTSLVAEYLSICLRDDRSVGNFRNILAVTFTNNATAEMKSRIVQTLQQFAFLSQDEWGGSEKAIASMVKRALPSLTDAQLQHRSEMLLAEILYDYPNFSISTIDSFFQRIVRAFAFELGISMSYEVEVTLDDCFQQTIDLLLNRISKENPDLRDAVLELVEDQMSEKGRWRIDGRLLELLYIVYGDEAAAEPLAALSACERLKECLNKQAQRISEARTQLLQVSEGANEYIDNLGVNSEEVKSTVYNWFQNYSPFVHKHDKRVDNVLANDGTFFNRRVRQNEENNVLIKQRCRELLDAQDEYFRLKTLYGRMQTLSLLFDLKSIMDEIRERDNKFFLSDTNFKIHSEIKDDDTPFIYEKIGNRYRYFFVDEFQDTSRMQWENLIPLLKNALAYPDGKAILFGDVKQAIYRFRNGDAQLLTDLSAEHATEEYLKLMPGDEECSRREMVPMKVNYRSDGNIVNFNNAFFQRMPKLHGFKGFDAAGGNNPFAELYQSYYHAVKQEVRADRECKGVVVVRFKPSDMKKEEYFEEQVNAAVADALDKGYRLCDIAVLTSSNADGSLLGQTLARAGYAVISPESLMLKSSPEVNLVLAVLGYMCHPNDKLSQYIIAQYVLMSKSEDESEAMEKLLPQLGNEHSFCDFMDNQDIQLSRTELADKPLFTLVNEILRIFSISAADAFVVALMDNILDYLKNQNGEISSFLDWWDKKREGLALKAPSGLDAITISTIHKSKGLQYPVVIMPFTQYGYKNTKTDFWYAKEGEELPYLLLKVQKDMAQLGLGDVYDKESMLSTLDSLNKIYVAQTRAENRLYILTGSSDAGTGNFNKMLYDFVTNSPFEDERENEVKVHFEHEPDDESCFWWGNRDERRVDGGKSSVHESEEITKMYIADFNPADLSTHIVKEETREQEVGNAIHDYLSRQTHFPLTEENVNAWKIDADQPYADEIRDALRCIARHTEWHPYFADGVKVLNEVSILPTRDFMQQESREGEVRPRLTYRPDRVVQLDDGVVVLDYKTGHPTDAARTAYERQVATYVELLSDMSLGPVRGEVLYLNEE